MKQLGIIATVIGIIGLIYAFTMDTSVEVNYPAGSKSLGINLPKRVNNIGLMQERQNLLIIMGVITLAGVIFTVSGKNKSKQTNDSNTSIAEGDKKIEEGLKMDVEVRCLNCSEINILDDSEISERKFTCNNCGTLIRF